MKILPTRQNIISLVSTHLVISFSIHNQYIFGQPFLIYFLVIQKIYWGINQIQCPICSIYIYISGKTQINSATTWVYCVSPQLSCLVLYWMFLYAWSISTQTYVSRKTTMNHWTKFVEAKYVLASNEWICIWFIVKTPKHFR